MTSSLPKCDTYKVYILKLFMVNNFLQNYSDSKKLLDPTNINQRELVNFAKESAQWATKDKMANLDFAKNHNGKDDVAIFDFTAMHQAEHSCLIREKHGKQLLECIVGDTLIEVCIN